MTLSRTKVMTSLIAAGLLVWVVGQHQVNAQAQRGAGAGGRGGGQLAGGCDR